MSHTKASRKDLVEVVERIKNYYEAVSFLTGIALCDERC